MTIGEKIKKTRKEQGMTQRELCGDVITRNMLSRIENNAALPSLETLTYIASRLGIPAGFLLLDENDALLSVRADKVKAARIMFAERRFNDCLKALDEIDDMDDELYLILAHCHFNIGLDYFNGGSLHSAARHFELSSENAKKTIYDTSSIESAMMLYTTVCNNVNLPLLDFDREAYEILAKASVHLEFFKYLISDMEYEYVSKQYSTHVSAKKLLKDRKYAAALELLTDIEETRRNFPPNAFLMLSVYADMEICYKNLLDFERAYKYSSKRISLLEGFST